MDDKRVRIGVDASGYEEYSAKIRQSSDALARDMIRSARSYTTSAKEVTSSLEEQIRLIEKRNKLDEDFRKASIQKRYESGAMSEDKYKSALQGITIESKEDKLQTQILRELLDTVKNTAKQEIREDRLAVERQLEASRTVDVLNPKGDEMQILKETLQRQELGRIKDEEGIDRGGGAGRFNRGVDNAIDLVSSRTGVDVISKGSKDLAGGLGKLGTGGIIGAIIAATIGKTVSVLGESTMNVEQSARQYAISTGANLGMYRDKDGKLVGGIGSTVKDLDKMNLSRFGMTPADYLGEYGSLTASSKTNLGEDPLRLMMLSRGTFLNEGDVSGLVGLRRYGGATATGTSDYFDKFIRETGQSLAVLPEIIQQFSQEAKNITMQTGSFNPQQLAALMTTFSSQTGLKGDLLGSTFGSMQQGMMRSQNPAVLALQLRSAREALGNEASFTDLEKLMESPFSSEKGVDYVSNMLKKLKGITGGGQMYERALRDVGVAPTLTLAEDIAKFDPDSKEFRQQIKKFSGKSVSFEEPTSRVFGEVTKSAALLEGSKQAVAYENMTKLVGEFNSAVGSLKDFLNGKDQREIERLRRVEELSKKIEENHATFLEKLEYTLKKDRLSNEEAVNRLKRSRGAWN